MTAQHEDAPAPLSVNLRPRVTWTLQIPELPPLALSPNGAHGHWRPRADAIDWLRTRTRELAGQQLVAWAAAGKAGRWPIDPALITVQAFEFIASGKTHQRPPYFASDRYRPEDVPNLISALKPMYDGLTDAGLIAGDRHYQLAIGPHRIVPVDTFEAEGLLVTLEALLA